MSGETSIPNFDEAEYLAAHPDVAAAVRDAMFPSGLDHYEKFGQAEGRSLKAPPPELTREEKIFHLLDKAGLGLEIGPSHNLIGRMPYRAFQNTWMFTHGGLRLLCFDWSCSIWHAWG